MTRTGKKLIILAVFTFFLSPLFAWGSILTCKETAVFASLSRMIWYSGSAYRIFLAMLILFIPMIIAFCSAHTMSRLSDVQKRICRIGLADSCSMLYLGAMWVMPSDGRSMTSENIWHGVLCFGGMFLLFVTYCIYTAFLHRKDRDGAGLLAAFLVFTLISSAFAVLNVFDGDSYVIASAVAELYVLTMLSLIGYLTLYLAYRKQKTEVLPPKTDLGQKP